MRLKQVDKLQRVSERRQTEDRSYWIEEKGLGTVYRFICAHCGNREREKTNFCSYCGYVMDKDDERQEVKDGVVIKVN
jgi:hypothetical protein